MKKLTLVFSFFLTILMLWGCAKESFDADEDTIYVKKKGTVMVAVVESFDKEYYSEEELKALVEEEVGEYTESAGEDAAQVQTFQVKDKVAKVFINYKTGKDYGAFNKVEFFSGTLEQALGADYGFEGEFLSAENAAPVNRETIFTDGESKVVIFEEPVHLRIDGRILYYSNNLVILSKDMVKATEETEGLAYVIYKDK